jgi:predicted O-methyltransferase YrrM
LREDWEAWSPLVAPGGIIAIHDSRATPEGHSEAVGSVRFTNDVILRDSRFEVAEAVDSLTVLRRRSLA